MRERRKTRRSGQALVLVTLALIAMAGILGLAVDLGWSFFVQKQAQAAADGAALAAVQEALQDIRAANMAVTAFTCGSVANVACQAAPISCGNVSGTSNLANGCQYAIANGFNYTSPSSSQNVTIMAGTTAPPPTAPGVMNVAYWVTVRTVQTIPQLFSAVLGNPTGTVSAIATAAIAGSVMPASFYGMNHAGDCITDPSSLGYPGCGLDVVTGTANGGGNGGGTMSCPGAPGGTANLCAPAGIILASSCNASSGSPYCSQPYVGMAQSGTVYGSSLTVKSYGALATSGSGVWSPSTPNYNGTWNTFQDPYLNVPQPPLQVPSGGQLPACGVLGGVIPSSNGNATLGPFQYFSYHVNNSTGKNVPDGLPIVLPSNATFSASAGCPGQLQIQGSGTSSTFPTYIFYGGLVTGDTANFGPVQYVMAGTNSNAAGATVFNANDGSKGSTITGDSATGTMFIFTDGNYGYGQPWALAQQSTLITSDPSMGGNPMPTLYQGTIAFKNANISLYGVVGSGNAGTSLPSSLNNYQGVVWWQDRRNSVVGYNEPSGYPGCGNCTGDNGYVLYCQDTAECGTAQGVPGQQMTTALSQANGTTTTSPGVTMDPGNGNIALHGVYYQPRGAWMEFVHGTTGFSCGATTNCPLQVVTGALIEDQGGTGLLLAGPTNPIITYRTALIQ